MPSLKMSAFSTSLAECTSRATVAGRRYCHYALDQVFKKSAEQYTDVCRMTYLLRTLLNSAVFVRGAKLLDGACGAGAPVRADDESYVGDVQFIMLEYWNAFETEYAATQGGSAAKRGKEFSAQYRAWRM